MQSIAALVLSSLAVFLIGFFPTLVFLGYFKYPNTRGGEVLEKNKQDTLQKIGGYLFLLSDVMVIEEPKRDCVRIYIRNGIELIFYNYQDGSKQIDEFIKSWKEFKSQTLR